MASVVEGRDLLSVAQSAARKTVSTATIRRAIAAGDIHAIRLGKRIIRVDRESLDAWGQPLQYIGDSAA